MSDNDFQRMDSVDDPERCQGNGPHGQCTLKAIEGSRNCKIHGGNMTLQSKEKKSIYKLRVAQWQSSIGRHANHSELKSLREEIGVLRMILEERLNKCETDVDLVTHSQQISELVMKIQTTVLSCDKLEDKMGQLLSKDTVLQFASEFVDVIKEFVNADDLEVIVERMNEVVSR